MNVEHVSRAITAALEALEGGSRQGHRPSAQRDFGVYTADLRGVVRRFKKVLKPQSAEQVLELAQRLIRENVTECRQVAYELVAGHKLAREALNESMVEALGRGIDNWACVDSFCCNIAGLAWREGRISDALISRWASSDDLWWRRAAVVSTVALNTKSRGGTGDPARTFAVCAPLLEDPEVMVQKAISWAIRELVPWDRKSVVSFLDQNQESVSARVRREVTTKLETGRKN